MITQHRDGISWQAVISEWVQEGYAYVIDQKRARRLVTTDSLVNQKLDQSSTDFMIISRKPLTVEQQLAVINQFLSEV